MKRIEIIDEARSWKGTPVHHQGRKKGAGVDCLGLIVGIARDLGLKVQDRTDYSKAGDIKKLEAEMRRQLVEIDPREAKPGDILVFQPSARDRTPHVALITDRGILHAYNAQGRSNQSGKVVEHVLNEKWRRRISSAFRFSEVED